MDRKIDNRPYHIVFTIMGITTLVSICFFVLSNEWSNKIETKNIQMLKPISITYENRNEDKIEDRVEKFEFGEIIKYASRDSLGGIKYEFDKYDLVESQ